MNSQYEVRGLLNGSEAYSFRAFLAKSYSLLLALKMSLIFLSLESLVRSCVCSFYRWVVYIWYPSDEGNKILKQSFPVFKEKARYVLKPPTSLTTYLKRLYPQRTLQIFSDTVHWSWLATEWHLWDRSIDCRGFWGYIHIEATVTLWAESRRS